MAITPAQLLPTTPLPAAGAPLYTSPTGVNSMVKRAVLTNTSGAAVTVLLCRVPAGGTAAVGNQVLPGISVPANSTYIAYELENMVLEPGAELYGNAGAAGAVNLSVAGLTF